MNSNLSLEQQSPLRVCQTLLSSLTVKDKSLFNSTLHPSGLFINVRHATRGTILFNSTNGGIQGYLDQIWNTNAVFEECVDSGRELIVLVDHDIATVWTPYWVRWDGKLSHVGTNSFGLAKVVTTQANVEDNSRSSELTRSEIPKGELGDSECNWEWKVVTMHDTARPATAEEVGSP